MKRKILLPAGMRDVQDVPFSHIFWRVDADLAQPCWPLGAHVRAKVVCL